MKKLLILCSVFPLLWFTTGCTKLPHTLGEKQTSFSYIPLDPLPVLEGKAFSCFADTTGGMRTELIDVLSSLPDQAVRLAIGQVNASGSISYGPATVGVENQSYQVILDYISVDATHIPIYVSRIITSGPDTGKEISTFSDSIKFSTKYIVSTAPRFASNLQEKQNLPAYVQGKGEKVIIPVYIGVGLRLVASVTVLKGKVNLGSLGALAAAAEAGKISGSLVVQTLGVTGNKVSTTLPLPSEINQTTIQNAILSLGSIKAVLYDTENTIITPRVVGIYNPIGGGQELVNGIISQLAQEPVTWYRPCKSKLTAIR
jgi:hypothetical protein